jgi:hypothetical protein
MFHETILAPKPWSIRQAGGQGTTTIMGFPAAAGSQ